MQPVARYVFVGAGAVGSGLGGLLARAGDEVLLVARGDHQREMATNGLRVRCPDTASTVRVTSVTGPEDVRLTPSDVLVLTTETQQAEAALAQWADVPVHDAGGRVLGGASDQLPVLTALDGVAGEDIALRSFERVFGVCVWFPTVMVEPGADPTAIARRAARDGLAPGAVDPDQIRARLGLMPGRCDQHERPRGRDRCPRGGSTGSRSAEQTRTAPLPTQQRSHGPVEPISERAIRASFVNCSKGAAKRLRTPVDLASQPWEDLDFLGWADPVSADQSYLVVPREDELVGLVLRRGRGGSRRAQTCSACLTTHVDGGVSLMGAARAGESGRRGSSVGTYLCSDLDCSLYARRRKTPRLGGNHRDDFDPDERVEHLRGAILAFVARVRS